MMKKVFERGHRASASMMHAAFALSDGYKSMGYCAGHRGFLRIENFKTRKVFFVFTQSNCTRSKPVICLAAFFALHAAESVEATIDGNVDARHER